MTIIETKHCIPFSLHLCKSWSEIEQDSFDFNVKEISTSLWPSKLLLKHCFVLAFRWKLPKKNKIECQLLATIRTPNIFCLLHEKIASYVGFFSKMLSENASLLGSSKYLYVHLNVEVCIRFLLRLEFSSPPFKFKSTYNIYLLK